MKEETEFKPKPMVMIGNKPVLWHIMKIYASYGFNEFILALGYKGDYIKDFFLNQKAFTSDFTLNTRNHHTKFFLENRSEIDDFRITFVDTGLETMPGERILKCRDYIPERDKYFMVTYGDGVTNLDLAALVKFHKSKKTIGTITAVHPRSRYGLVMIGRNGMVESFKEKPILDNWVNGGFMVFDKRFFNYLRPGETEHPALERLARAKQLAVFKNNGFWYAIDTYREFEELNKIWATGKAAWKVWK